MDRLAEVKSLEISTVVCDGRTSTVPSQIGETYVFNDRRGTRALLFHIDTCGSVCSFHEASLYGDLELTPTDWQVNTYSLLKLFIALDELPVYTNQPRNLCSCLLRI